MNEWSFDKKFPLLSKIFFFSLPDKDIKDTLESDLLGQLTSLGYDKNLCTNVLNISSQNINDSIKLLNGSTKTCEQALQLANNDINIAITLLISETETCEKPNSNEKVESEDNDLIN